MSGPIRARTCLTAAVVAVGLATGCQHQPPAGSPPLAPADLANRDAPCESVSPLGPDDLDRVGDQIRLSLRPATPPARRYDILVLSGGGSFGAYSAGVLCGWTEAGTRPQFDVITGISTGALVATLAFAGPAYDDQLRRSYTTVTNDDIFRIRKPLRSLLSASIADNTPLAEHIAAVVTPEFLAVVAAEHAKGRRLYVGTTNLTTKRLVVWDLGAVAARNTPGSRELFVHVLLASAAVPGFFPPVRFPVDVDGRVCEEVHVDGGVSRPLFFRAPYVPPAERAGFGPQSLYGSNLYVIVAGKLYPDPQPVKLKALSLAASSIGSVVSAATRAEVYRLYTTSVFTGMNYRLTAIPPEFPAPAQNLKFEPAAMTRMFEEGRRQALTGTAWTDHPPEQAKSEDVRARTGLWLTVPPVEACDARPPVVPLVPPPADPPRRIPDLPPGR